MAIKYIVILFIPYFKQNGGVNMVIFFGNDVIEFDKSEYEKILNIINKNYFECTGDLLRELKKEKIKFTAYIKIIRTKIKKVSNRNKNFYY